MTNDALACGDLIAYRRYAYARSCAEEGDWRAAAEVSETKTNGNATESEQKPNQ